MKTDNTDTPFVVKQCPNSGEWNATIVKCESKEEEKENEATTEKEEAHKLCENMDCERYPPDWDVEEDTEETYQEGQWKKCCLCDGYFDDDGTGDILYIQEEPNNKEAECSLCGKNQDIVQMKGSGQYLCGNACDESADESDDESNDETEPTVEPDESNDESDDETDVIIEQCKTLCSNWLINNNIRMSNIEHIETSINKITHRSHFSNMMFSHVFMIMPCIWWMHIDRPDTDNAVFYSKLMSIIMSIAVMCSYLYHYYNECILCNAETTYMVFATASLNIYMYLRNVSVFHILPGGVLLFALNKGLTCCNSKTVEFYEIYHPFCHYIAGLYIYYCVWNLEHAQQNVCDITTNHVIYNDIYSGVNYPAIHI
jgi:hypothetical protein